MCYYRGIRPISDRTIEKEDAITAYKVLGKMTHDYESPYRGSVWYNNYMEGVINYDCDNYHTLYDERGIYSFKSVEAAKDYRLKFRYIATVVEIKIWGRVLEYENHYGARAGYRSSRAEIVAEVQ
jgi:hypothetical protein